MKAMTNNTVSCKAFQDALPDLLLEPGYATEHPEISRHRLECAECRSEFEDLRRTFAVMDEWTAPEPSAYFDTRLHARLREEVQARPEGFFERMRSFLLYSTGRQFRPVAAGVLGCALLLGGGGTFAGLYFHNGTVASATVNDLKVMDNNAQAEQQISQLLDDGAKDDAGQDPTS